MSGAVGSARVEIVCIDGPSGSGKTEFADALTARLRGEAADVVLVRTDDFATWDCPAAWWPRFRTGVLEPLIRGRPGGYRSVEWAGGNPTWGAWVDVPAAQVLVLEGVTSARRAMTEGPVCGLITRVCWIEWGGSGPEGEARRLERAVARDGEGCRTPLRRWQRFERGWFAVDDTRSRCEVVRPG